MRCLCVCFEFKEGRSMSSKPKTAEPHKDQLKDTYPSIETLADL
jgi:hypothetical protein